MKKLRWKLAISLLISAFGVWGWAGLENQTQNFVHVKHSLYHGDMSLVLEFFILKLFEGHLAQNDLNVCSSYSTMGSIHQSVVEKTFPGCVSWETLSPGGKAS